MFVPPVSLAAFLAKPARCSFALPSLLLFPLVPAVFVRAGCGVAALATTVLLQRGSPLSLVYLRDWWPRDSVVDNSSGVPLLA
jgi:hypothetical protein